MPQVSGHMFANANICAHAGCHPARVLIPFMRLRPGRRRAALCYRRASAAARTGTISGTAPAIASASESLKASSEARCAATSAR